MKFVSRVCCFFVAFGLVACDTPEREALTNAGIEAAKENAFAGDIIPFATACVETFQTGALVGSPMVEAGFVLTKWPNQLNFQKVVAEPSWSYTSGNFTIAGIRKTYCWWSANFNGSYVGAAENAIQVLKRYGYVEVNSDRQDARFFTKNDLTIRVTANVSSSQYGETTAVELRIIDPRK